MKQCSTCGETKALSEFYKDATRASGYYPSCRPCSRQAKKASRLRSQEDPVRRREQRAYFKKWRLDHPDSVAKSYKKQSLKAYGLTLEAYEELLCVQGGLCAICGGRDQVPGRALAVDHDHVTGQVRGLLCSKCNRGIGMLNHDVTTLLNAILYLERNLK